MSEIDTGRPFQRRSTKIMKSVLTEMITEPRFPRVDSDQPQTVLVYRVTVR